MIKAKKIVLIAAAIILFGLYCLILAALSPSRFSREVITLPDGGKVYVMLEEWGRDYKRISITQNPRGCQPPNPDTDYISKDFINDVLVYKITDKGLVIFDSGAYNISDEWHEPRIPWTKNAPTFEYCESDMMVRPKDFGVTILRVDSSRTKESDRIASGIRTYSRQWCFLNLFLQSSSLRPGILEQEEW